MISKLSPLRGIPWIHSNSSGNTHTHNLPLHVVCRHTNLPCSFRGTLSSLSPQALYLLCNIHLGLPLTALLDKQWPTHISFPGTGAVLKLKVSHLAPLLAQANWNDWSTYLGSFCLIPVLGVLGLLFKWLFDLVWFGSIFISLFGRIHPPGFSWKGSKSFKTCMSEMFLICLHMC